MLASLPAHYPNLGKVGRFWVGGWLGAYKKILKNANFLRKKKYVVKHKKKFAKIFLYQILFVPL